MENILHIGAKVDKESVENLAGGINIIFESAFRNHVSQDNIENALNTLSRAFEVKNVTVTNSTFVGEDHTVVVNKKDEI
jgi:hypothetical protein